MKTNTLQFRYLYSASFKEFIETLPETLYGIIQSQMHGCTMTTTQDALMGELQILQNALKPWSDEDAEIIFEYNIPRLGKRIDVVLLLRGMIFCLEFKVGQESALNIDKDQVMQYALDLKNFHKKSEDRTVVPILIPTNLGRRTNVLQFSHYNDNVFNPIECGAEFLTAVIQDVIDFKKAYTPEVVQDWAKSPYAPTPTIIEAARTLYENHSVKDITRHEADAASTDATIGYILDIIAQTKARNKKSICFVTGVPGAGKTLVGLEIAVKQSYQDDGSFNIDDGAVYLSGNGPLVAVLTEALARNNHNKLKEQGIRKNFSTCKSEVGKFIQIIHRYRDNMLAKLENPVVDGQLKIDPDKALKMGKSGYGEVEHVAIFDEAQRAWTHGRIASYLKRGGTYGNKLKVPNFPVSEAAFLIWSLDQREDWATIVCLVGGGQEINTGEAGISEWIDALNNHFPDWKIYISNQLTEKEYAEGRVSELLAENSNVTYNDALHLAVSLRSFRAEKLSSFIHSVLSIDDSAREIYKCVAANNYPIYLTRDIDKAREWLKNQTRGQERSGLLITKTSARFKPLAIHALAPGDEDAVHWFLEDKDDVRCSNYLEDAATEIQVQGLELDYTCVVWDADMQYHDGAWTYHKFNGKTKWRPERNEENQRYMLNAYRVLLTRARQGMVICVPTGNHDDGTRTPQHYDDTFNYLKSIGIPVLE